MNSAKVGRGVLVGLSVLLLLGSNAAFANTSQSLKMSVPVGVVTDLGTQTYAVSGGMVYGGTVNGVDINPGAKLQYSLFATQSGMSTQGYGSFQMSGTTAGGSRFTVSGTFSIDSSIAAGAVGSSELPFYFVSSAPDIRMTVGGVTEQLAQPLMIESPYWSPWGGPITITSYDGYTLAIAASYKVGTIYWQGSQVQGSLVGTFGASPVSGTLTLNTNEVENLVSGYASDSGTIAFSGMSPSSLNSQGYYTGSSTIPTADAYDCSTDFPVLPGTCTYTGFQSQGSFRAGEISGTYSTQWSSPALEFGSSISATVSQAQQGNDGGSHHGFWGFLGFSGSHGLFGFLSWL